MNPLFSLAALGSAILAMPFRGSLELADRTEVRGGWFALPTDPSLYAETIPSGTIALDNRRLFFVLGYAPRLGLVDLQKGINFSYLHSGMFQTEWRERDFNVFVNEYASYGSLNFSALQLPSAGPNSVLRVDPNLRQRIEYEASSTTLAAVYKPVSRWLFRLSASYSLSGGVEHSDRVVLPFFRGPRFEALSEHKFTPRQTAFVRATAEQSTIEPGTDPHFDYRFLGASAGYRQNLSRLLQAEGSAGVTEVRSDVPKSSGRSVSYNAYLTAAAQVFFHVPTTDQLELRLSTQIAPAVNRITTLLTQQVQGTFGAVLRERTWGFTIEGGFAQTIDASDAATFSFLLGQAKAAYRASKYVDLEAGALWSWQKVGFAVDPSLQELAFVAVTVRAPVIHF